MTGDRLCAKNRDRGMESADGKAAAGSALIQGDILICLQQVTIGMIVLHSIGKRRLYRRQQQQTPLRMASNPSISDTTHGSRLP
jgi:hypothetical protein